MSNTLKCLHCSESLEPDTILNNCTVAWPELNWIYLTCHHCLKHSHIRVENDAMSTINFIGAPGPDYEVVKTINLPNFRIRIDPAYIHVWNNGKRHEYKAQEKEI